MKTQQIVYYLIFLLTGGLGGYFIGARSNEAGSNPPVPLTASTNDKETPVAAPAVPGPVTTTAAPAPGATTTAAPATTTANGLPTESMCFSGEKELEEDLNLYASKIEALELMYSHELMQDCSGIFYRLVKEFAKQKCNSYAYPEPDVAGRPAYMIAKWYHDHKNFVMVNDPMASRNLIKPGAVMFYGKPGAKYNNVTIDQLATRGGVFHIGVVTSVTRDTEGNVTQYTLFHGRSTGKIASRTSYHNVRGPANLGQPVLGVGSEEWVGIGSLFTPAG